MRTPSSRRVGAGVPHRRMKRRREEEADAGLGEAALDDRRRRRDVDAERFEDVGAAGLARHRAVAVLGDAHAAGGDDERRARRDVERARTDRRRCRRCRTRRRSRRDSCTACARIVRARPTISAGRSPFIARPTSRPAICAGAARPSMTSAIAAAASSVGQVFVARQLLDQCGKHALSPADPSRKLRRMRRALVGQDRLGMKLHAVHRPRPVPQAHDRAVLLRPRRHLELGRQPVVGDDQRVIARRQERPGRCPRTRRGRRARSSRSCRASARAARTTDAAEHRADRLMPEADAEDRRRLPELRGSRPS